MTSKTLICVISFLTVVSVSFIIAFAITYDEKRRDNNATNNTNNNNIDGFGVTEDERQQKGAAAAELLLIRTRQLPLKNKNDGREVNGIPCNIIQTFISQSIPARMLQAINNNVTSNEEWNHMYFDDIDAQLFMQKHFDGKINNAYEKLIPGAFKSDVFRLCAVYFYGGCYMDVTMVLESPLDDLIKMELSSQSGHKLLIPHDEPCVTGYPLYQAFFISTRHNPLLMRILMKIVALVEQNNSPTDTLSYTGPGTVGIAVNEVYGRGSQQPYGLNEELTHPECGSVVLLRHTINSQIVTRTGALIATSKYKNWQKDRTPGTHYSHHVREQNVYFPYFIPKNTTPPPPPPSSSQIPKVIVQTWNSRFVFSSVQKSWKSFHVDTFTHYMFTDMERRQCVSLCGKSTLQAYDSLVAGAYRADLWRICYLYINGGMYVDADMVLTNKTVLCQLFDDIATYNINLVVTRDINHERICNGVMMCTKHHALMKDQITRITKNVLSQKKFISDLDLCGPGCLTNGYRAVYNEDSFPLGINPTNGTLILSYEKDGFIHYNNTAFILAKDADYNEERKMVPNSNFVGHQNKRRCHAMTALIFS
jgi:mannosyltransferase OCH1-like enzyme